MINLNSEIFEKKSSDFENYDIATTAKILNYNFGRTTLYRILKNIGIVDEYNVPAEEMINKGLMDYEIRNANRYKPAPVAKTVVVGDKGLKFIKEQVDNYLKSNDIPRYKRAPRGWSGGIDL